VIALFPEADRSWMADAACRGADDPNLWHSDAGTPPAHVFDICNGCPVRERCADYADMHGERHGVWGGMTTEQRNRRARQREVRS